MPMPGALYTGMPVLDKGSHLFEVADDLLVSDFANKGARSHHRQAAQLACQQRQLAGIARVGAGAAQHDRHAVIHTGHDLMKQLTAFFDGHHREFTVGTANQQTVITPDQSRVQYFHVTPESRSRRWR